MTTDDGDRWDARWAEATPLPPSTFYRRFEADLPRTGRALDVAGGLGRHAIAMAERGLDTTLVDVSAVALARAAELAADSGVPLTTLERDLEREPLPDGPFDAALCHHFLDRALFAQFPRVLAPGGVLLFCQPTTTNLERHEKPSRRFLLEPGELEGLVKALEVVHLEEAWTEDGRHEAWLVARRPA